MCTTFIEILKFFIRLLIDLKLEISFLVPGNYRLNSGNVYVVISDTLSYLLLDRRAFSIQSFHVNCMYSLPEFFYRTL